MTQTQLQAATAGAFDSKGSDLNLWDTFTSWLYQEFGSGEKQAAALALQNPDVAYPTMPGPVPPPAIPGTPATPASEVAARAAVDAAIAAGSTATKESLQTYFTSVFGGLNQSSNCTLDSSDPNCLKSGLSFWAWVAIATAGAGVIFLLASQGGRGRR
jgi:hypothetical protein